MFTEEHKHKISEAQCRAWQGKRQKAVIGEVRIIQGKQRVRTLSPKGWHYWKIVPGPLPSIDEIMQMPAHRRAFFRKRGIAIPKRSAGRKRGYKEHVSTRLKKSISKRQYLFDIYAIAREQKERVRKSLVYRLWREGVFKRDNYTCQKCSIRSGNGHTIYLEAHHKKSFSKFPALRFEAANGVTLCRKCHLKIERKRMLGNQNGRRRASAGIISTIALL